jgi:endonuclease/exonuclease/phosphatase family metal-dependent hydrolase
MTYNIRFDNPEDSANAWPNRKQKVFDLLKKYDPDVIGLQEVLHHQLMHLVDQNPDYAFVGVGRDDGKTQGEYSPIIYKKSKFELIEQNTFWLSEKPDKPGSKNWDAAITRVASWAILSDKTTGRKFLMMNTHFDHIGSEARKQSATIIKAKADQLAVEMPVVISGDFNCTPDDEPHQLMVNGELFELLDHASQPTGTFCGFKVGGIECQLIDYIFLSSEWQADRYNVIQDNDGVYYPSDHLPVMLNVSLTE